jgi:hypothetical protein
MGMGCPIDQIGMLVIGCSVGHDGYWMFLFIMLVYWLLDVLYRQNQSTTENCENSNYPDLVRPFLKKLWIESDFKAPNLLNTIETVVCWLLDVLLAMMVIGCSYSSCWYAGYWMFCRP